MLKLNSRCVLLIICSLMAPGCQADDNRFTVPQCPKFIEVQNHQPVVPEGWEVSLAFRYINEPNKYQLKDGEHQTNRIAPMVSYVHEDRLDPIVHLGPLDEDFFDTKEVYSWYPTEPDKKWVFYCDADSSIFLYKPIPKDIKKCTLTINLTKGERTWENQTLECFKE